MVIADSSSTSGLVREPAKTACDDEQHRPFIIRSHQLASVMASCAVLCCEDLPRTPAAAAGPACIPHQLSAPNL